MLCGSKAMNKNNGGGKKEDVYKIVPFCLCRLNSSIRWGQISTIQRTVHGDETKKNGSK